MINNNNDIRNTEGKKSRIQALIMIILGFVLAFSLLTATIIYTVYDRSLINFIQDFGKEEPKEPEEEEVYINPALMELKTADSEFKNGLWIITDSPLSNLSADKQNSVKERSFYSHKISNTNFDTEPLLTHLDTEKSLTIREILEEKPAYLMLNFSNAILDLDEISCKNFYNGILTLVNEVSPATTVIISGPLPVFANNQTVQMVDIYRINDMLETIAGELHEEGFAVYYLTTPTTSALCNADGTLLAQYQDGDNLSAYGCWIYFDKHILQYSIPESLESTGAQS